MKGPFHLQVTEHDCVPTSFVNALVALFDRKEIPPSVVQHIWTTTLDTVTQRQSLGHGTSWRAIQALSEWLNARKVGKFNVEVDACEGEDATAALDGLSDHLDEGGVALLKVRDTAAGSDWHYVLALAQEGDWLYCFDPYPRKNLPKDPSVGWDHRSRFSGDIEGSEWAGKRGPNCRLELQRVLAEEGRYSMGEPSERQCVLLERV